jgi:hypothetical protein
MMKRLAVLALVGGLAFTAACQRDAPTAPAVVEEEAPTPAAPSLVISAEALANFSVAVDDVTSRILPTLEDAALVEQLQGNLQDLVASFSVGNAVEAQRALSGAQAVLSGSELESLADLDVVQLVLDQAAVLLSAAD